MARGIISTVLGGVAGGLEGYRDQALRREEQRRKDEEIERLQRDNEFRNQFMLMQAGGTPGARLQQDFAGQAQARMGQREGAVARALDSAPIQPAMPAEGAPRRGLESAVGRAFDAAQIAPERERFVPQVQDQDYFEMQTPGGGFFSLRTPEALERLEAERAERARLTSKDDWREQQDYLRDIRAEETRASNKQEEDMIRLRATLAANQMTEGNTFDGLSMRDIEMAVRDFAARPIVTTGIGGQTSTRMPSGREIQRFYDELMAGLNRTSGLSQDRSIPSYGNRFLDLFGVYGGG